MQSKVGDGINQRDIQKVFNDEPEILGVINIYHRSKFKRLLQRVRLLPRQRTLTIRGLTSGTVERIRSEMCDMNISFDGEISIQDQVNVLMRDNLGKIFNILALAVHNSPFPVPRELAGEIASMTLPELANAIVIVYGRLDVSSFFVILDLLKGLNLTDIPDQTPLGQP